MNENARKREFYSIEIQKDLMSALNILLSTITMLDKSEETINLDDILCRLCDTAKITANSRKAFITSTLKHLKQILENEKTNKYLYDV